MAYEMAAGTDLKQKALTEGATYSSVGAIKRVGDLPGLDVAKKDVSAINQTKTVGGSTVHDPIKKMAPGMITPGDLTMTLKLGDLSTLHALAGVVLAYQVAFKSGATYGGNGFLSKTSPKGQDEDGEYIVDITITPSDEWTFVPAA